MPLNVRLLERGANAEPGRELPVTQSEFLIGRNADCNLRLPSASVSRHHCSLRLTADEATVWDLGSSNGTYLNDTRVRAQAVLHSGDVLRVGEYEFVIDLGDAQGVPLRAGQVDPLAVTLRLPDPRKK
jgi:pSer/pThr/pTyr-binding forkhead associated (FHA) protein